VGGLFSTHPTSHSLASTRCFPILSTFNMFFNHHNISGPNFGYPTPENNNLGFSGYDSEVNYGEPSAHATPADGFDHVAFSAVEIENWWLASQPEGDAGQYTGSTLLSSADGELAGTFGSQPGQTYDYGLNTGESYFSLPPAINTAFNADNNHR